MAQRRHWPARKVDRADDTILTIVSNRAEGIPFKLLDRPFEGLRPVDPSWGTAPADLEASFRHERGPESGGIIEIAQARVFGAALVYTERGGEPHALEIDQNFLHNATAASALVKSHGCSAAGTLQIRKIAGDVVLLSKFPYGLYGHWMVKFMPRL